MHADTTYLNGLYTGFGKVIEGMEVIEKIEKVDVTYRSSELKEGEEAPKDKDGNALQADKPKKDVVIESISVETYGADYGMPKTMDVFDYYSWLMQQYGMSLQ